MGTKYGDTLDKTNLILFFDPANKKSYPCSGTNIYDLSVKSNNIPGVIYAGGSYLSDNLGIINFTGSTNSFIRLTRTDLNGGTFSYQQLTVIMFVYLPTSGNTNGFSQHNLITVENSFEIAINNRSNGYSGLAYASNPWAWYGTDTDVILNNSWNMIAYTHSYSSRILYVNGVNIFQRNENGYLSVGTSTYPYLTLMARYAGATALTVGKMGPTMIYGDRVLNSTELLNIYNMYIPRYN